MSSQRSPWRVLLFTALVLLNRAGGLWAWEETGIASWYGGIFQGRTTANGETYDTYGFTAAHRSLPFGTILDVTNLETNRVVRVRVNDRGPFVDNRIIDLTYAAAKELDMIRDGTAEVRLVAVEGSIPEVLFTVQIGAWGDPDNALGHRRRLEEAGLNPTFSLSAGGVTRISLVDVTEDRVFDLVEILESLGYADLFIYQTSGER